MGNKAQRVTGATFIILNDSGEMLMQLRDNHSKRFPNTWCFPGGTIELNESELTTVTREIKEEYELELSEAACYELMAYTLSYGSACKVFVCRVQNYQKPVMHEGAEMKWMKIDEIKKIPLGFEQGEILPKLEIFLKIQK
ncbi:NUDIX domain-containing protein [Patescibacteria group bacterium]|nr:NUDIX domain-containing protein [Patescibacteria group bacterium]